MNNSGSIWIKPQRESEFRNWQEFFDWYSMVQDDDYTYHGHRIEGFVIEDAQGYMTKVKTVYYRFWKQMRGTAREVLKKGCIGNTAFLITPVANQFYGWLREKYDEGELKKLPRDICSLRRRFLEEQIFLGFSPA